MADQHVIGSRGDLYGHRYAAFQACELIRSVVLGEAGPRYIRVEARDEGAWDDVVLYSHSESEAESQTNYQVKRLNAALSRDEFEKLIRQVASNDQPERFHFVLREFVNIDLPKSSGRTLSLMDLADLCKIAQGSGTVPDDLAKSIGQKGAWWQYIGETIGDEGTDAVFGVVSRLELQRAGTEEEIRDAAVRSLQGIYDAPGRVFDALRQFIADEQDPSRKFDYQILCEAAVSQGALRTHNHPQWVRFEQRMTYGSWTLRASCDLGRLVSNAWAAGVRQGQIHVDAVPTRGEHKDQEAVARLLAHRAAPTVAPVPGLASWRERIEATVGGTIGVRPGVDEVALATGPCLAPSGALPHSFTREQLAALLSEQMDAEFWLRLQDAMRSALADPGLALEHELAPEVAEAASEVWCQWLGSLDSDIVLRRHFLTRLVATCIELSTVGFAPTVRVGPKLMSEIVKALCLGAVVSAALKRGGESLTPSAGNSHANLAVGQVPCHLLALSAASSATNPRGAKVYSMVHQFLPEEPGLTLLASVGSSSREIVNFANNQSYHADDTDQDQYQADYCRTPVLTSEPAFWVSTTQGMDAVRAFLAREFRHWTDDEVNFMRDAVMAPTGGNAP